MIPNRPEFIKRGSNIRKHWNTTNELIAATGETSVEVARLRKLVVEGERGTYRTERNPFEVYSIPRHKRNEDDYTPGEWTALIADGWRTFQVRHGYANFVSVAGCDDADGAGTTPDKITVPDLTDAFYIWCDLTAAAAPIIKHTTFPSGVVTHWAGYPTVTGDIRPLARINTTTTSSKRRAIIIQFQNDHIWPAGSAGGDARWS